VKELFNCEIAVECDAREIELDVAMTTAAACPRLQQQLSDVKRLNRYLENEVVSFSVLSAHTLM